MYVSIFEHVLYVCYARRPRNHFSNKRSHAVLFETKPFENGFHVLRRAVSPIIRAPEEVRLLVPMGHIIIVSFPRPGYAREHAPDDVKKAKSIV